MYLVFKGGQVFIMSSKQMGFCSQNGMQHNLNNYQTQEFMDSHSVQQNVENPSDKAWIDIKIL